MDDTGKCIADQGGVAEAFQYLADLKAAGATFYPAYDDIAAGFKDGTLDMIVDGPWAAGGYVAWYRERSASRRCRPAPSGPALPLTGVDGWIINPNGADQSSRSQFANRMAEAENQKIFADTAYHIPAHASPPSPRTRSAPSSRRPSQSGYPRPQSAASAPSGATSGTRSTRSSTRAPTRRGRRRGVRSDEHRQRSLESRNVAVQRVGRRACGAPAPIR